MEYQNLYLPSSSVYGIKDKNVVEESELKPLTVTQSKVVKEGRLKQGEHFCPVILRPSTEWLSPRLRLDVLLI